MEKEDLKNNKENQEDEGIKEDFDNEHELEEPINKVNDLEKALVALNDSLLREKADKENLRKRMSKELEDAHKYSISTFAKDLIDVLENLYRAVDNINSIESIADEQIKNFYEGVLMTQKILLSAFEKNNITRLYPLHELFDHNYHQAISQLIDEEKEANTIVQVVRAGYMIRDRLLQPAMVIVSKKS